MMWYGVILSAISLAFIFPNFIKYIITVHLLGMIGINPSGASKAWDATEGRLTPSSQPWRIISGVIGLITGVILLYKGIFEFL